MNIVLTGFMGTGKTEVGKKLAEKIGYDFIDTDELIEKKTLMKISDIFENFGETYFRKIESALVDEVSRLDRKVISTGGGVVLKKENMNVLSKNGAIINLSALAETIYSRLKGKNDRPLLIKADVPGEIKKLLEIRKEYYDRCDLSLATDNLSVDETVQKILEYLKQVIPDIA